MTLTVVQHNGIWQTSTRRTGVRGSTGFGGFSKWGHAYPTWKRCCESRSLGIDRYDPSKTLVPLIPPEAQAHSIAPCAHLSTQILTCFRSIGRSPVWAPALSASVPGASVAPTAASPHTWPIPFSVPTYCPSTPFLVASVGWNRRWIDRLGGVTLGVGDSASGWVGCGLSDLHRPCTSHSCSVPHF